MNNPEASRCLLCKNPRCSSFCPIGTAVPTCIKLYREGRIEEAGAILFENNPFSAITSLVCDWGRLCRGHCVLTRRGDPIKWHELESEISSLYLSAYHPANLPRPKAKVAIVGAGPAGITAAIKLREAACDVDIFDKAPRIGGVLRYGIPDFRLDKSLIDNYERILNELGVRFFPNTKLSKDISLSHLQERYDSCIIAAGAGIPRKLNIPGEEDCPKVLYALDYLSDPGKFPLKGKVIVIGGGNVTMDAARTAVRSGCDTHIYYRKTYENMPAGDHEITGATRDGVQFHIFEVPVAIENGKAIMRHCENVTAEDGSVRTRTIPGSEHPVDFDTMIIAVSANSDPAISVEGLDGVFTCGDFQLGPRTVVEAVSSAKSAVDETIKHLKNKNILTD